MPLTCGVCPVWAWRLTTQDFGLYRLPCDDFTRLHSPESHCTCDKDQLLREANRYHHAMWCPALGAALEEAARKLAAGTNQ